MMKRGSRVNALGADYLGEGRVLFGKRGYWYVRFGPRGVEPYRRWELRAVSV